MKGESLDTLGSESGEPGFFKLKALFFFFFSL
jgi:hypothetical protein